MQTSRGPQEPVTTISPSGIVVMRHRMLAEVVTGTGVAEGVTSRRLLSYEDAGNAQALFDAVPQGLWFEGRVSDDANIYTIVNGASMVITVNEPGEEPREIELGPFAVVLIPAGIDHSIRNDAAQQAHVFTISYKP